MARELEAMWRVNASTDDTYTLGRTAEEERRLQRQAALFEPFTRRLFTAAGIGPGMKVLDLGTGAGDVALLAAEVVGPGGSVVGIDHNPVILETAQRRARAAGHPNVTFLEGDIRTIVVDDDFDALVGRAIISHVREPVEILRHFLSSVRPGGVAAFSSYDFTIPGFAYPPSPLNTAAFRWIAQAGTYGGMDMEAAIKLHQIFCDSGWGVPQMFVDVHLGGDREFVQELTSYWADTIRSLLPLLVRGGFASEEEIGIETLAARWCEEILAQGGMIRSYPFVSAWARKP